MFQLDNTSSIEDLLYTTREALKGLLSSSDGENRYTTLMVINAIGIVSRAISSQQQTLIELLANNPNVKQWMRQADQSQINDPELMNQLKQHVQHKLSVTNPKFIGDNSR